ncbi:hypothetical protein GSI_02248 [Ganoderma sinense ZZ0214-1]|uniref:Uncharacterized protein n=1 Tax=Ganoderma sinense ZZ0214-1 TaxID=1077348 RepID=A0A2G8SP35_9APHY|nr:hypothetical protein GSI_02248 [Ganoderma sinense ZZ0214-1]
MGGDAVESTGRRSRKRRHGEHSELWGPGRKKRRLNPTAEPDEAAYDGLPGSVWRKRSRHRETPVHDVANPPLRQRERIMLTLLFAVEYGVHRLLLGNWETLVL